MIRIARLVAVAVVPLAIGGCLSDRVVTLTPHEPAMDAAQAGEGQPVAVLAFAERRGAIAEGGLDAVGGLYGLRGWPAALLVAEPYSATLQRALVAALAARGIPATAGPTGPAATHVLSGSIIDFYGYSNWGAAATLTAHVRLDAPDGSYVIDKVISREVKQLGWDTYRPRLEDMLARAMTAWVGALVSDPAITGPLLAP